MIDKHSRGILSKKFPPAAESGFVNCLVGFLKKICDFVTKEENRNACFPTSSDVFPLPEEVPTARRKFPLPEEVPTGSAK
uniref:Uncharacterized protein n=1 Tax=Tanacetum cinerariifolium TaxID=118510 RepID=A0A699L8B7_TANCI|nr:hypothetical protein [Tanacetum cinerariifolium]